MTLIDELSRVFNAEGRVVTGGGRTVFFPFGAMTKGYVLDQSTSERLMHFMMKTRHLPIISLAVIIAAGIPFVGPGDDLVRFLTVMAIQIAASLMVLGIRTLMEFNMVRHLPRAADVTFDRAELRRRMLEEPPVTDRTMLLSTAFWSVVSTLAGAAVASQSTIVQRPVGMVAIVLGLALCMCGLFELYRRLRHLRSMVQAGAE
jgi:hypothetical protein